MEGNKQEQTGADTAEFIKVPIAGHEGSPAYTDGDEGVSIFYISDLHIDIRAWKKEPERRFRTDSGHVQWIPTEHGLREVTDKAVSGLLSDEYFSYIQRFPKRIFLFLGDIADSIDMTELFFREFARRWDDCYSRWYTAMHQVRCGPVPQSAPQDIIYIPGNHDLRHFKTYADGAAAYRKRLGELGIRVLCDQAIDCGSFLMAGGTGWAGLEDHVYQRTDSGKTWTYNADHIIGPEGMTHAEEKELSDSFCRLYQRGLAAAVERDIPLVCATHYPVETWLPESMADRRCIFFNGHMHADTYRDTDAGTVYADNQVGNHGAFSFKRAVTGQYADPFRDYMDGYCEIDPYDYLDSCYYRKERIRLGQIRERLSKHPDMKFYMVKHAGHYGFFLCGDTGTFLCNGEDAVRISRISDIRYMNDSFQAIVEKNGRAAFSFASHVLCGWNDALWQQYLLEYHADKTYWLPVKKALEQFRIKTAEHAVRKDWRQFLSVEGSLVTPDMVEAVFGEVTKDYPGIRTGFLNAGTSLDRIYFPYRTAEMGDLYYGRKRRHGVILSDPVSPEEQEAYVAHIPEHIKSLPDIKKMLHSRHFVESAGTWRYRISIPEINSLAKKYTEWKRTSPKGVPRAAFMKDFTPLWSNCSAFMDRLSPAQAKRLLSIRDDIVKRYQTKLDTGHLQEKTRKRYEEIIAEIGDRPNL